MFKVLQAVCATRASAKAIIANVSARQENTAKDIEIGLRCEMAAIVTLRAMQAFRTMLQQKERFVQRYRKQTSQANRT